MSVPFQPDALLPEQYFSMAKKRQTQGEKRLMAGVLEDAVHCFQTYVLSQKTRERGLYKEAETWILSTDRHWLMSFENVCEAIGLEPEYIRNGLMRWKEGVLAAQAGRMEGKRYETKGV